MMGFNRCNLGSEHNLSAAWKRSLLNRRSTGRIYEWASRMSRPWMLYWQTPTRGHHDHRPSHCFFNNWLRFDSFCILFWVTPKKIIYIVSRGRTPHRPPYRWPYGGCHCTVRALSKFGPYMATAYLVPYSTVFYSHIQP